MIYKGSADRIAVKVSSQKLPQPGHSPERRQGHPRKPKATFSIIESDLQVAFSLSLSGNVPHGGCLEECVAIANKDVNQTLALEMQVSP